MKKVQMKQTFCVVLVSVLMNMAPAWVLGKGSVVLVRFKTKEPQHHASYRIFKTNQLEA